MFDYKNIQISQMDNVCINGVSEFSSNNCLENEQILL